MASDSELPKPQLPKPSLPSPTLPAPTLPSVPPPSIPPVKVETPVATPPPAGTAPVEEADVSEADFDAEETIPVVKEATLGNRIVGALIDLAAAAVLYGVLSRISGPVGWLAMMGYLLVKDSLPFLDGQSLGKKVVKTKAVTLAGESLAGNWKAGVVRNAPLAVPFLSWVELVVLLINKDEPIGLRRLGDQWAKTKVIPFP